MACRKEIYISDADAKLIAEVQELSDEKSLSAIVVQALSGWLKTKRQAQEGLELRELQPGRWPTEDAPLLRQRVKFVGRLLVGAKYEDDEIASRVYQTKGGSIVVESEVGPGFCMDERGSAFSGVVRLVHIYDELDSVPHFDGDDIGSRDLWDGQIPDALWEDAKIKLGELPPKWVD